jgi:hypothetical protein
VASFYAKGFFIVFNSNHFPPNIELTTLYEKTSAKGTKYFVGRLGLARISLLPAHPPRDDGQVAWKLLIQQAAPMPKPAESDAQKSNFAAPHKSQGARRRAPSKSLFGPTLDPLPDDRVDDLWQANANG